MKTVKQGLIAAAFILAMAAFGTSSDAIAGGGHHHDKVDRDHHGGHGKLYHVARGKRVHASRAKSKRYVRTLKPGRHSHHRHSHHRHPHHKHRPRRHGGHSSQVPDFLNGGTVLGALAGGVIGNQIGSGRGRVAATAGGALLGAIVGNGIYRSIQASDEARVARVLESTPSGQTVTWRNPDTGNSFKVTPRPAFKGAGRRDCRAYTTWAFLDGYEKEISGVACRDSQGRWQLMNG